MISLGDVRLTCGRLFVCIEETKVETFGTEKGLSRDERYFHKHSINTKRLVLDHHARPRSDCLFPPRSGSHKATRLLPLLFPLRIERNNLFLVLFILVKRPTLSIDHTVALKVILSCRFLLEERQIQIV